MSIGPTSLTLGIVEKIMSPIKKPEYVMSL